MDIFHKCINYAGLEMDILFLLFFMFVKFLIGVAVFHSLAGVIISETLQERERHFIKDHVSEKLREKQKEQFGYSIILSLVLTLFGGFVGEFIIMIPLGVVMYLMYQQVSFMYCVGACFLAAAVINALSFAIVVVPQVF